MTVKKRGMMSKDGHMDRMKMNSSPPLAGDVCPLLSLVWLLKKLLLRCLVWTWTVSRLTTPPLSLGVVYYLLDIRYFMESLLFSSQGRFGNVCDMYDVT